MPAAIAKNVAMSLLTAATLLLAGCASMGEPVTSAMVVRKARYEYLLAAVAGDELEVGTWLTGSGGRLQMTRHFQVRRGADGAMTGFAYPDAMVKTRELYLAGKRDDAEDVYDAYLPIIRQEHK